MSRKDYYFVYLVLTKKNTIYTGYTNNLSRRMEEHRGIREGGSKYILRKGGFEKLLYFEIHKGSKDVALTREYEIKHWHKSGKNYISPKYNRQYKEYLIENISVEILDYAAEILRLPGNKSLGVNFNQLKKQEHRKNKKALINYIRQRGDNTWSSSTQPLAPLVWHKDLLREESDGLQKARDEEGRKQLEERMNREKVLLEEQAKRDEAFERYLNKGGELLSGVIRFVLTCIVLGIVFGIADKFSGIPFGVWFLGSWLCLMLFIWFVNTLNKLFETARLVSLKLSDTEEEADEVLGLAVLVVIALVLTVIAAVVIGNLLV